MKKSQGTARSERTNPPSRKINRLPWNGPGPGISRALKRSGFCPISNSDWSDWRKPIIAGRRACLAAVCDVPLTGDDVAVLNVVRMGDEPKRLSEVGQLLNSCRCPQSAIRRAQARSRRLDRDRGRLIAQGNTLSSDRDRTFGDRSLRRPARRNVAADARRAGRLGGKLGDREHPSGSDLEPICSSRAAAAITRRHQP